jgi:hypothetical protein
MALNRPEFYRLSIFSQQEKKSCQSSRSVFGLLSFCYVRGMCSVWYAIKNLTAKRLCFVKFYNLMK